LSCIFALLILEIWARTTYISIIRSFFLQEQDLSAIFADFELFWGLTNEKSCFATLMLKHMILTVTKAAWTI